MSDPIGGSVFKDSSRTGSSPSGRGMIHNELSNSEDRLIKGVPSVFRCEISWEERNLGIKPLWSRYDHKKPEFELEESKMESNGSFRELIEQRFAAMLEGDVGRLHDDLLRLETSLKCCLGSCGAAGSLEPKEKMWSFCNQVESIRRMMKIIDSPSLDSRYGRFKRRAWKLMCTNKIYACPNCKVSKVCSCDKGSRPAGSLAVWLAHQPSGWPSSRPAGHPAAWLDGSAVNLGEKINPPLSIKVIKNKPKGNNVAGPSVVNMVEHNNSSRYTDNRGKRKHHDNTKADPNKKSKVTCWKCGKPGHLKNDCKGGNFGNKANDDDVTWWVDSGATVHLCKDRCWFKTYKSLNDGSILHIENESTTLVHGCGCVDLRFSSGKIVFLFNILNVPNIRKNLVSSSNLNNCGYKQVIESNKFVLSKHDVLVHVHFTRMQDMSKDGLILAFDMDTEKCKTCMLTKITKKPFQNVKHETEVLELIHSDLCDPHATPSLGNEKYFVIFIDDASKFCYVYLHSKDEALDKFKVFKTEVELQQESLIKRFRTDRGGETESRVLGEAMLTTCYLLNMVPNKRNMITPYELWIKRKPNLNYLRVWGCRAVIGLPDSKLKTLGKRGIECIFVGYAEHSKGFRFYVIEPIKSVAINSIIESREAIFDGNKLSSVPRLSQRSLINKNEDIGGSVVLGVVIKEVVVQQPEPELRKGKRNRTPKNFGPEYQLYLIKGTRDEVFNQHSYCFNVEDDPETFDETMKSQDVADLLVANGQKSGIDYFDTYALVARIGTIRLLIALVSIHNLIIHQMDVKTTFLNGGLEEEVYMNQRQGFIMLDNENKVDLTKEFLSSRLSMKDMGEANVILDIRINYESNGIAISQSHYIAKVLKKFNYFNCTPVSTLMDTSEKLMPNNGQVVSQIKYYRVIGCLMYVMTYTRPDIAFVVGKLNMYTSNPGYPSVLEGFTDASWISNTEDNSSTSGWVFLLGGDATSWVSNKQTCITSSTMESEFVALAVAGKEAEWLRNLILDILLWSKPITPISIHCDSAATLAMAYSQMYNGKSRHLGVRHNMIREIIMNGVVSIKFVRSQQNLADHLTNGLARDLVLKSAEGMGLNSYRIIGLEVKSVLPWVTKSPDFDIGKRKFKSLMKFSECISEVNGIHQSDGFSFELVYETDSLLGNVGEKVMRCQLIEESYASITSKKKKTGVDNLRNHLDDLGGLPPKRRPKTPDVIRKMVIFLTLMRPQLWDRNIIRSNAIFQCVYGEFKKFSNQDMLQEGALADKILGKITSVTLQTMSRNASKDALLNWQLEMIAEVSTYPKSDTLMLNKLPSGISGMTSLQFLSNVIIEGSNRHKISKLKGMMELRGRLSNEGLYKNDYQNKENENEVFEKLKPHRELRGLNILYYGGRRCLGSLKKLFVEGMPKVVIIAPELFPSLEVLELEDMYVDCSKLDDVLIGKMSSFRVILCMERCSEAVLTSIIGASSSIISLEMDNISGLTPLHGEVLQHLGIISCRNMKSFPHTLLPTLASLKELLITNYPLMESFLGCSWPPKNRTLKKAYVRMGTSEFLNILLCSFSQVVRDTSVRFIVAIPMSSAVFPNDANFLQNLREGQGNNMVLPSLLPLLTDQFSLPCMSSSSKTSSDGNYSGAIVTTLGLPTLQNSLASKLTSHNHEAAKLADNKDHRLVQVNT
ncbi:zinc finger, CCHC-type containing protein [Tanacetum coccineum]